MSVSSNKFRRDVDGVLSTAALAALILVSSPKVARAQDNAPSLAAPSSDKPLAFEVATIKEVDTKSGGIHMTGTNVYPGGRVLLQNLSLKAMIEAAFGFSYWQISGGESWTNDTTFDVEGRAPEEDMGAPFNLGHTWFTLEDPRLRQMLQTLLNDRFQLKAHIEKKRALSTTWKSPANHFSSRRPSNPRK
jgi:Protein of unknown function (DUF3738)